MLDLNHLHPMIVHFPIALLIVGFLFDLIGTLLKKEFYSNAGFYLLILGTVGVVAAYLSGGYAGDGVSEAGALKQALETHEAAAELSLWLMAVASITRIGFVVLKKYNGIFKWVALVLFFAGVLSIARTGYYGGELVFKHAAGVQLNLGFDFNSDNSKNIDNSGTDED
jgi:uncharacterized membrane protein